MNIQVVVAILVIGVSVTTGNFLSMLELRQEKFEMTFNQEFCSSAEWELKSPGQPDSVLNLQINLKVALPEDTQVRVALLREDEARNVSFGRALQHNLCTYIRTDRLFWPGFLRFGNLPRACPVLPGAYYVRNYRIPMEDMPPVVPEGRYYVVFEVTTQEVDIMSIIGAGSVSKKQK